MHLYIGRRLAEQTGWSDMLDSGGPEGQVREQQCPFLLDSSCPAAAQQLEQCTQAAGAVPYPTSKLPHTLQQLRLTMCSGV